MMIDDQERLSNIARYDAWITLNRKLGKVGDEAWGRWVAAKYTQTGKCPADPLFTYPEPVVHAHQSVNTPAKDVNKPVNKDRKAYRREWMRKKRAEDK